jgi:hypothetical protein
VAEHDEVLAEQIRSTHRRHGKVCGCCGRSWPCTDVAWATRGGEARRTGVRALVLIVFILAGLIVAVLLSVLTDATVYAP